MLDHLSQNTGGLIEVDDLVTESEVPLLYVVLYVLEIESVTKND